MNHMIYQYSLCASLSLMIFFGLYFMIAKTPEKAIFYNSNNTMLHEIFTGTISPV